MTALKLENVCVTYGRKPAVPALVDASLAIEAGEVLALLGPSGCGKSSLLGAVAGIVPVTAGRVWWQGSEITDVPVHQRGFGLVFQEGHLFPHRNVRENITFGLEMQRWEESARHDRVEELLELVGLTHLGTRTIDALSGGERQRVALARALAPRPGLLMLDEPLSSLDQELRTNLAHELREILTTTGTTAILVTHDEDEAQVIADRVQRMRAGRLET